MTNETKKINLRSLQDQSELDAVKPVIDKTCEEFKSRRRESLRKLIDDVTSLRVKIGDKLEVAVIPYRTSFIAPITSFFRQGELVEIYSDTLEKYFENLKSYRQPPIPFNLLPRHGALIYNVEFQPPINEEGVPAYGLLHLRKDLDDFDIYSQIKIGFPSIIDYKRI